MLNISFLIHYDLYFYCRSILEFVICGIIFKPHQKFENSYFQIISLYLLKNFFQSLFSVGCDYCF